MDLSELIYLIPGISLDYNLITKMSDSPPQYYPLIPDAAFLYRPAYEDLLTPSGKQRLIFEGNVVIAPHQEQKLMEFQNYLSSNNINLDRYWNPGRRLRLLQANVFNFQKTIFDMNRYLEWITKQHPIKLTSQHQNLLHEGIIYVCGRDSKYRPIVVFDVKKALSHNLSPDEAADFLSYFYQHIVDNMMIEGQVENWVIIIDIGGMGITDSVDIMKKVGTALSARFHNRMGRCYIVRATATFNFIWMIAKNFLYQDTVKKISFTSKSTAKQIFEDCHPSQIEEKYGGTMPNIQKFWPIQNFSDQYQMAGKPSKLISPSQYYEEYSKGLLAHKKISKKLIQMYQPKTRSTQSNTTSSPKLLLSSPRTSKNMQQVTFDKPQEIIQFPQPSILKSPSDFENFPTRKYSETKISFGEDQSIKMKSSGLISTATGISSMRSIINIQGNINPIIHFRLNSNKPKSFVT